MIIVEVAGHLGSDPEERMTANGKRVVSLRIAARVRHSGQDETVWWRVNVWGDRFDRMIPYLKKGSPVIVIGEMGKPEIYTARDGSSQISLSMTAEMVKFSPFGRPDKPEQQTRSTADEGFAAKHAFGNSYAANSSSALPEESFASVGDDLPF